MTRLATLISLFFAGTLLASPPQPNVIYGEDNRKDTYESKSLIHLKLAERTAAHISAKNLVVRGSTVEIHGPPLTEFRPIQGGSGVCQKERFSHQPTASNCSGFLVSDNVIATAGHCILSQASCTDYRWVFNYKVADGNQTAVSVSTADVYRCARIMKQSHTDVEDYALIQLDRPLPGRALRVARADPPIGTPLVMIGHPSGLPQKITDGGIILSNLSKGFRTSLDAFSGNSGSAVFNDRTGELLGILSNGNTDYKHNPSLNCSEVNVMPMNQGGEGVSSFRQFMANF